MPSAEKYLDTLRRRAFDGLDASAHEVDLQGWVNAGFDEALAHVVDRLGDSRVVFEVGSWKGASAVRIADALKARGGPATLVCIDEFAAAGNLNLRVFGENWVVTV